MLNSPGREFSRLHCPASRLRLQWVAKQFPSMKHLIQILATLLRSCTRHPYLAACMNQRPCFQTGP